MKVPVLWISRHPEILARGYYDEALLEALFARELWTPPDALEFEHIELHEQDFPEVDGAVVVLPARHHASPQDVSWFLGQLERLKWSVVILAGDERWVFPWHLVKQTPTRKVWIMQPRPEHAGMDGLIPGGWYPNTREWIKPSWRQEEGPAVLRALPNGLFYESGGAFEERPLEFFFAGQITHSRREECAAVLQNLPNGWLHRTNGYLQGMPREQYTATLSQAKVIPCPSGPYTVDTARPLEAMEAGCIPIVDMVTPRGEDYDYWSLVFGDDCPLTRIWDWAYFPKLLEAELADWPHNANRIYAWWQSWKRDLVYKLEAQIREVSIGYDT